MFSNDMKDRAAYNYAWQQILDYIFPIWKIIGPYCQIERNACYFKHKSGQY